MLFRHDYLLRRYVKILVVLDVTEHNDVLVIDGLALVAVLVARFNHKNHQLAALCILTHHVAGLIKVSAVFASLEKRLAVIMVQLDLVAVLHYFALTTI